MMIVYIIVGVAIINYTVVSVVLEIDSMQPLVCYAVDLQITSDTILHVLNCLHLETPPVDT